MSNRKEHLKKSLGITEYPWSSDDEEDPVNNVIENRATSPLLIGPDMPGPSRAPVITNADPALNQVRSQYQPGVTRRDRDLFWSILNNQQPRTQGTRNAVPPLTTMSSADIRNRHNPSLDRMTTFRNLSRRINTLVERSPLLGTAGPSRSSLFTPNASDVSGSIHPRSRGVLLKLTYRSQGRNDNQRAGEPITPDNAAPPLARYAPRARVIQSSTPRASTAANTRSPQSITFDNLMQNVSDMLHQHELGSTNVSNTSSAIPTAPDENFENLIIDGINAGSSSMSSDSLSEHLEASTSGNSSNGVTLERDIVEIASDDRANDVEMVLGDENQNASDQAIIDSSEQQLNKRMKRKRETASAVDKPQTVKEFNQMLLRTLECPVCLEWMEPPMSQCRRGHLICANCRKRLSACPVCRTVFSSVRNRAMEGVADMLRYPCRHGCGRELRLRKRSPHESSCPARLYRCPLPACSTNAPLPHSSLALHFQGNHTSMLKFGNKHKFSMKLNCDWHENWIVMAMDEFYHLRTDVDLRTWGIMLYVAYIGPKKKANNFTYQVVVEGHARRHVYMRTTHGDTENVFENMSRQDCFHLTLDQALNFLKVKNRNVETDKYLEMNVEINKCETPNIDSSHREDSDS